MEVHLVWISHISNLSLIQVLYEKPALDMESEFHELGPLIGHPRDGTIKQLSDIISSELKSEENNI
jgi:hypothetical protein